MLDLDLKLDLDRALKQFLPFLTFHGSFTKNSPNSALYLTLLISEKKSKYLQNMAAKLSERKSANW